MQVVVLVNDPSREEMSAFAGPPGSGWNGIDEIQEKLTEVATKAVTEHVEKILKEYRKPKPFDWHKII
jgi:hypothetical protein